MKIKYYFKEMRIKSWLKNSFVFFPVIFSKELLQWDIFLQTIILVLAFCFVSSAIYVLNDICDVENDRKHDVKKNRPIASGQISIPSACTLAVCLMIAGLGMAFCINLSSFGLVVIYLVINILYSKWLKKKAPIDCFCIAAGFVLRVLVGGTIVSEGVSEWMFLTVIALSLFMAFGKRRGELHSYECGDTRNVLEEYEMKFLDGTVFMCAALCVVFYSLWAISHENGFVYTVPMVLFIVLRYLLLVFKGRKDADPTTLILSDKMLLIFSGICAIIMMIMLYGTQMMTVLTSFWN